MSLYPHMLWIRMVNIMYEIINEELVDLSRPLKYANTQLSEHKVPFSYVKKVAAQIARNEYLMSEDEAVVHTLANHLYEAGCLKLRCFHKEWRREVDIDKALVWGRTKQGADFWKRIRHTGVVPQYIGDITWKTM